MNKGDTCLIKIKKGTLNPYPTVNLEIDKINLHKGRVYAVRGTFGSGKSTFLKALAGLVNSQFKAKISGKVGFV